MRLLLISLTLAALSLIITASIIDVRLPAPSPAPQAAIQMVNSVEKPLYRLSLIPGGAGSMFELDLQVQLDPVLQRFYRNFDFSKQREFMIDKDMDVYMSFRIGNDIRWTKKKVHIKAGEKAVTDGKYTILLRCGNMIAWSPQGSDLYPAEPLNPTILETPVPITMPDTETAFVPDADLIFPPGSGLPPVDGYMPQNLLLIGTPLYPPILTATPLEPSPTPESSSLTLIVIGVIILFVKKGIQ